MTFEGAIAAGLLAAFLVFLCASFVGLLRHDLDEARKAKRAENARRAREAWEDRLAKAAYDQRERDRKLNRSAVRRNHRALVRKGRS